MGGWSERLRALDVLIVQLDADVLDQPQFSGIPDLQSPCDTVKAWVDASPPPRGVVITLPKRSTDAWLLAALSPEHRPAAEAHAKPADELLAALGVGKNQYAYREHAPAITRELAALREHLPELDRFVRKLEALKKSAYAV